MNQHSSKKTTKLKSITTNEIMENEGAENASIQDQTAIISSNIIIRILPSMPRSPTKLF